ncbi:hypothetical protein C815_01741 [Firmicutes bacterium M10-2]|nr:hypothetical protein C815_01741 [Firmicutes bacterium M10-2]
MNAKILKLAACASLVLSLTACSNASSSDEEKNNTVDDLIRTTQYGEVQGIEEDGVEVYYGIPYGKEPVDDLRWKAPQDPDPWTDVKDTTQKEEIALQATSTTNEEGETIVEATGSTDCLNLDVYTTSDFEKKPVLVYIHGGNNQTGSSFEIPGIDMVKNDDLVYVSVNYRLGLLGFNNLPALIDEENNTGNFAMLDLAKSLQWVKDNIENFGGDSENVTVSGFSAGGRDVMAMLISPVFKGLFDKSIAFSGGMTIAQEDDSIKKIAETIAPLVVEDHEADNEADAAKWLMSDDEKVKDYLYSIDSDRLVKLFPNAGIRMAKFPHLYNDGVVIPKDGFESDYVNDVPIMMITGSEEFTMFGGMDPAIDSMKAPDEAREFIKKYGGDFYRIFNTQLSAEKMADSYQSNIYLGQINYGDRNSDHVIEGLGSFHGIFVPAISPSQNNYSEMYDFTEAGYVEMAKDFNEYLASFVKDSTPISSSANVEWTPWTVKDPKTLVFDAKGEQAEIEMEDVSTSNEAIIEAIEDDRLDDADKEVIISTIMNGRWFSQDLDEHFKTPNLW